MKNILVLGATSAIAMECTKIWASQKSRFFLVGRDEEKLSQTAADLVSRGATSVSTYGLDLTDSTRFDSMIDTCINTIGQIDLILLAHGTLPDQKSCESDIDLAIREFHTNCLSSISLLTKLAPILEQQGCGKVVVISSVAGDRGRASNYLYGAAKAAVSTFTEGLRGRLFKSGVHVLLVKPGFVDTPMTKDLNLPKLLVSSPQKVAEQITAGVEANRNVLYTPGFWALIMLIIKTIPSSIFKRLPL